MVGQTLQQQHKPLQPSAGCSVQASVYAALARWLYATAAHHSALQGGTLSIHLKLTGTGRQAHATQDAGWVSGKGLCGRADGAQAARPAILQAANAVEQQPAVPGRDGKKDGWGLEGADGGILRSFSTSCSSNAQCS